MIAVTLLICILIALKVKKNNLLTIDGILSVVGLVLGLIITSLNMIYSNNYLISLGPLLAITCLLYLSLRDKILTNITDFNFNFSNKTLKEVDILYWICISIALFSYHQAAPYNRPPIFYIAISISVALLGLEIISSKLNNNFNILYIISKIILTSLILRASAYFISPYPIGTDSLIHGEYIKYFIQFHYVMAPQGWDYYVNYPIMHLLAATTNLIGNISIKQSLFVIGAVLILSTLFVFLIVKKVTNNINLALLSMLLLNFADFHIQWSIVIIAMSFGIAIYTILIYLLLKRNEKHPLFYTPLLIVMIFIITLTHTISSFLALFSIVCLYLGSFIYHDIYAKHKYRELEGSLTLCMIFVVILVYHWMDPNYSFFDSVIRGLINSLSAEAKFLDRAEVSNVEERETLINILGFLIYVFFGIIGSLRCLSRKYANRTTVSLIFMLIILYFVFFAFPVMGLRNIVPYRWPAFIYISFVLFVGIGLVAFSNILKSKDLRIAFILVILFLLSFFMITNLFSNVDSPIYGKEINQKFVWSESEMVLFEMINNSYDDVIVTDFLSGFGPFKGYFKRSKIEYYPLMSGDNLDWDAIENKLVIWRKTSLTRPVQAGGNRHIDILLGDEFKNHLNENFSRIYNTGEAEAYIGIGKS